MRIYKPEESPLEERIRTTLLRFGEKIAAKEIDKYLSIKLISKDMYWTLRRKFQII